MSPAGAPFAVRLEASMRARRSRVCLGIDPRPGDHPLLSDGTAEPGAVADAVVRFYRAVLAGAHEAIACVKPQSAFFEALGLEGARALAAICDEARSLDLPIVLDAKRGDIGSTAEAYAATYLGAGPLRADALTVSPYLGFDTLEPFARHAVHNGRGLFVLVATSNAGAAELQDVETDDGRLVHERVADAVAALDEALVPRAERHGSYGPFGAVVGATRPGRLAALRARLPRSLLLVPGYGAQGGRVDDVVTAFDEERLGAVVSSSRALVPSSAAADIAAVERAARSLAMGMRDDIEAALERRAGPAPAPG